MKVVRSGVVESEGVIVAIFGDGRLDMRVFELTAIRLNHGAHKFVQMLPSREKGLEGAVKTLTSLLIYAGVKPKTFIVVLDRENVESADQLRDVLVRRYGFEIKTMEPVGEEGGNVYKVECTKGPLGVTIYIALLGLSEKGMLEEHIAKLVKAVYNVDVEPKKKSLRQWLRESGIELEELIKRAPLDSIRDALRPLYDLIVAVEGDP